MSSIRAVCLQDIADKSGVSRATVSLALRDAPSISMATRLRVREVAQELGYKPNPLVSALMTHQRSAKPAIQTNLRLAMLLRFSRQGGWETCIHRNLLEAANARAEQHGYGLEQMWLDDLNLPSQRLNTMLFTRGIPGLLVAPLPAAYGHLCLEWRHFSAVAIGQSVFRPALHRVCTNNFDAVRMVLRRLRRMGYERIGLAVSEDQDARSGYHWSSAFLWDQSRVTSSQRVSPLILPSVKWTERVFRTWFQACRPEAVLCCDASVREWVRNMGASVPDEVGMVQLAVTDPSLLETGVCQNQAALAVAAVDLLVSMIKRNERGIPQAPQTVSLEPQWVDGATTRCVRPVRPNGLAEVPPLPRCGSNLSPVTHRAITHSSPAGSFASAPTSPRIAQEARRLSTARVRQAA